MAAVGLQYPNWKWYIIGDPMRVPPAAAGGTDGQMPRDLCQNSSYPPVVSIPELRRFLFTISNSYTFITLIWTTAVNSNGAAFEDYLATMSDPDRRRVSRYPLIFSYSTIVA